MALHLVGETIDAKRAHLRAQSGELIQLVRGVYVDDDGSAETAVLSHAVRIAHYLYPNAYLSSASAALLAPTPDGRLFISGRRNQRTRLRNLEIVQNEAPPHPSTAVAVVGDDLGELRIDVSSPRQRFLEAFRLRSEHASAVTADMRTQMAARLVEEHGSARAAADAVWALARENAWYREGEGAECFLLVHPGLRKSRIFTHLKCEMMPRAYLNACQVYRQIGRPSRADFSGSLTVSTSRTMRPHVNHATTCCTILPVPPSDRGRGQFLKISCHRPSLACGWMATLRADG